MWQRFTERARKTVFYAQEEASKFGEGYVSTEHLLLGLCREQASAAMRVLRDLGITADKVRAEVESRMSRASDPPSQDMTLTARAKRMIDAAYDESRNLNNNYIGTEHLLLALIRDEGGVAGEALAALGVDLEIARLRIAEIQSEGGKEAGNLDSLDKSVGGLLERMLRRHRRATPDLLAEVLMVDEAPRMFYLFSELELSLPEAKVYVSEKLMATPSSVSSPINEFQLVEVVTLAVEEAGLASQPLGPEHFVPAIFRNERSHFAAYLRSKGITLEALRTAIRELKD